MQGPERNPGLAGPICWQKVDYLLALTYVICRSAAAFPLAVVLTERDPQGEQGRERDSS